MTHFQLPALHKFILSGMTPLMILTAVRAQTTTPQLGKSKNNDVVAAMTLAEKASIVIGGGRDAAPSMTDGSMIGHTDFRIPGGAGVTNAIPRLGIPAMVLVDGPAGVRMNVRRKGDSSLYYATAFPSETCLASTWNTALVTRVGEAFGNEVKAFGADIILAPGVNIHRNPLGGRNFEYYSEDPLVTGKMATAMINGLQSNGIGTSIKHYIANNHEANRAGINVVMDERTAREIYLKGFEIAVKASKPWTVMSSYNLVNGVHTSERQDLLTTILRDEWGFKGYVMTDWGGKAVNLIDQMVAGNDVIMPGNSKQINSIIEAVQQGKLNEKILDRNVERVLRIIEQSPSFRQYKYTSKPDLKQHARLVREAGAEGMVLLTNHRNTLPLPAQRRKVALLGNISYALIAGGAGSGDVNKAYTVSLYRGLLNAGYEPDSTLSLPYRNHVKDYRNWLKELYITDEQLAAAADVDDHAIITIGRNSWETKDRSLDSNYQLRPAELSLISRAARAFHQKNKKLIVVLNVCGVVDTKGWRDDADAILLAWQPGQEAGDAIADLLTGAINPSGKLATSFPENYADLPTARNFPGTPADNPDSVRYEEGIYIGYRYFDAFQVKPAFEFGYGLSYTSFAVSKPVLSSAVMKNRLVITAKVTNTGKMAGKEVIQLYIAAPAPDIHKPAQELKGFVKTRLLQPGAAELVTFEVTAADLASFYSNRHAWIADAGKYTLQLGTSSRQIRQTATFSMPKAVVTEKVQTVLLPSSPLQLLVRP